MCLGMLCAVLGGVRHVCHGLRVIDPVVYVCVCARAMAFTICHGGSSSASRAITAVFTPQTKNSAGFLMRRS